MEARLLVEDRFMKSNQFGRDDVPREPLVTIAGVYSEEVGKGAKKQKWWLLTFKEPWAKPLKINRTHQRACIVMFGKDTDSWLGKRLSLYAQPGKFFGGEVMGGSDSAVRIAGSPDLAAPVTFAVRGFGGDTTYNLKPMPASSGSPTPAARTPWQLVFGMCGKAGMAEAEITAFVKAVTTRTKPSEVLEADVELVRLALEARSAEPGAEG